MRQLFFRGQSFFLPAVTVVFRGVCLACLEDFSVVYVYIYIYIYIYIYVYACLLVFLV